MVRQEDSGVVRIGTSALYFPIRRLTARDLAAPDASLLAAVKWAMLGSTSIITHHDHGVDVVPFDGKSYSHQQFAALLPGLACRTGRSCWSAAPVGRRWRRVVSIWATRAVFADVMHPGDAERLADMRVATSVAWLDTSSPRRME